MIAILVGHLGWSSELIAKPDWDPRSVKLIESCRQRFLDEAPRAWQAIQNELISLEVRVVERTKEEGAAASVQSWLFCVGSHPDRRLAVAEGDRKAFATNERYSFSVDRAAINLPFTLLSCEPWERGARQPGVYLVGPTQTALASMWSVWWVPLPYVVEHADFVMVGAECGPSDDAPMTVVYRYDGRPVASPMCVPGAFYWAELEPTRSWAVVRSGVIGLVDGSRTTLAARVTTKYGMGLHNAPFPAKVVLDYEDLRRNRIVETRETTFSSLKSSTRPDDDYFLATYGLSESSLQILTPHRAWRIGALTLSVLGMAIAVALFWWLGRPTRARPPTVGTSRSEQHGA
jgi:hypothetical protein